MTNPMTKGLPPIHPGAILKEDVLPALGKSKTEVASALGVSRPTLYQVLDGQRPVTPDMAARLGKLLGNGGAFWLRLQADFDMAETETRLATELAAIPTWSAV